MKSVIMSIWLVMDGIGSLIVMIATEAQIIPRQVQIDEIHVKLFQ